MDTQVALGAAAYLAKRWEGLARVTTRTPVVSVAPYVCPAGYWTIGYGHLCSADHPAIGKLEAEAYLTQDLNKALSQTLALCPGLINDTPERLAAITDFTFNLGAGRLQASTLRRVINYGRWDEVPEQLRRWVWGGGKKLPGLILRREAEIALL
jgi:lysozyme